MNVEVIQGNDDATHLELHSFLPRVPLEVTNTAPSQQPGVVLIHGTVVTDRLYWPFARRLARTLDRPVYSYNRRGRGASSGQLKDYSIADEIADLKTVMNYTGSADVLGHSFGGFVALSAALELPIRRLVTYDAAVSLDGNLQSRWRPELEVDTASGRLDHAWAHLVQGLGTAGPISKLPLNMLRGISMLSAKTPRGSEMRALLPTAVVEMRALLRADRTAADFANISVPTLMLSGQFSPEYFGQTGLALAAASPLITFRTIPFQQHEGPIRPGPALMRNVREFLGPELT
ncbi:alpha/beta fold hydrolase [Pseudarthrobacter sp. J1738]|uniref:alpha/beta fold hydrolase n=1 Tax=Pseudarthrobacter sp. J1738 TaxID=3420446 RepID=UPI003D2AC905